MSPARAMAVMALVSAAGAPGAAQGALPPCVYDCTIGAQAGECRYVMDWSDPSEEIDWMMFQYADVGACASVLVERDPALGGWHLIARMDCREPTGSDQPVAYVATLSFTWYGAGSLRLGDDQASIAKAPTTLCAGGGMLQFEIAQPAATQLCAFMALTKAGAPYRVTETTCASAA